jgi:hypothetical protein
MGALNPVMIRIDAMDAQDDQAQDLDEDLDRAEHEDGDQTSAEDLLVELLALARDQREVLADIGQETIAMADRLERLEILFESWRLNQS